MKITRYKKVRRYLNFYCNSFGFRQPYQVLLDGTLCFSALKNKLNLRDQLPKYLDGEVKLLTTQCVILETEKLGPNLHGAFVVLKQFPVHKCGHEKKPVSAFECIQSMILPTNQNRYILATHDRDLQKLARTIPGTPLLYLHQQTPTLEKPSDLSFHAADVSMNSQVGVRKLDSDVLSKMKHQFGLVEEPKVIKKKKKKGNPNPLSCKKKKAKPGTVQKANPSEDTKKRKRRKHKIPKHLKEVLKESLTANA